MNTTVIDDFYKVNYRKFRANWEAIIEKVPLSFPTILKTVLISTSSLQSSD